MNGGAERLPERIVVGSRNPAKVEAVRAACALVLPGRPVEAVEARSGVPRQPFGMGAVRRGAVHRAWAAAAAGAWGVGLENGLVARAGRLYAAGWCVVACGRRVLGAASTPEYLLPAAVADEVEVARRGGGTLAEATAAVAGGSAGAWGTLGTAALVTGGALDRTELWRPAAVLALCVACWEAGCPPGGDARG